MTIQELEQDLQLLSLVDQAEAITILARLIEGQVRGVSKVPDVMGGDACITGTRIPVWLLVSYRNQGMTDAEILKGYPDLSAADLLCTWAYSQAHGEEIAVAIAAQEEADRLLEV